MDANGGANFEETAKFPLSELQRAVEELPSGVDPKCKEVCPKAWAMCELYVFSSSLNLTKTAVQFTKANVNKSP